LLNVKIYKNQELLKKHYVIYLKNYVI